MDGNKLASFHFWNEDGIERWVDYYPIDITPTGQTIIDNTITYNECFPGVDIKYTVHPHKLKMDIIYKTREAVREVTVTPVMSDGLTLIELEYGKLGFQDTETLEVLFETTTLDAWDSAEEPNKSDAFHYELIDGNIKIAIDDLNWFNNLTYPVTLDPTTVTEQVPAGADDGYIYGTSFDNSSTDLVIGNEFGDDCNSYARWTTVAVPQGATIDNAKVQYYINEGYAAIPTKIYFNDVDTATSPTSYSGFTDKTKTTAYVSWSIPDTTGWNDSPDIKTVIQEVVDRSGWASGNAMMVLHLYTKGTSSYCVYIYSYNQSSSYAPKLVITYTTSSSQTLTPTGISNTSTIGTPTLSPGSVTLQTTGITSTTSIGTPTMVPGNVTLQLTGISNTVVTGIPTILPGATSLLLSGISNAISIGGLTLVPSGVTLSLSGINSTSSIGFISVLPGNINLSLTGISSSAQIGTITLDISGYLMPNGIPSTSTIGIPTISPGFITLTLSGISNTISLGIPTILPGISNLLLTSIVDTNNIGEPTIIPGGTILTLNGINSSLGIGNATLKSVITLSINSITNEINTGNITLLPGNVNLSLTNIQSTTTIGTLEFIIDNILQVNNIPSALTIGNISLIPGVIINNIIYLKANYDYISQLNAEYNFILELYADIILETSLVGGIDMTVENQDFFMYKGDTRILNFTVDMPENTILSGSTIKWVIATPKVASITKTTTSGITITGDDTFTVTISPLDTSTLKSGYYFHEVQITDINSNVITAAKGRVTLLEDIVT